MTILETFWGGFSSFFSVWQVCILQISPFFMAFVVGLYLMNAAGNPEVSIRRDVLIPCGGYVAGFSLFYSLLIASGLEVGRALVMNIGNLRLVSGVVILLVSLFLILADRVPRLKDTIRPSVSSALSLAIGVAFAAIYSPCITPTMSVIMGLATRPGTAFNGWALALSYGLGMSLSFVVTGIALILLLRKREAATNNTRLLKDICGAILLAPALLSISGLMVYYKAFFLGLLLV